MKKRKPRPTTRTASRAGVRLLPLALLELPITQLALSADLAERLAARSLANVGDLLALPARAFGRSGWFGAADVAAVNDAITAALPRILAPAATATTAAASANTAPLLDQLLEPLDEAERTLFRLVVGENGKTPPRTAIARTLHVSLHELDDRIRLVRARLHERLPALLTRLRYEIGHELQAFDGVLDPAHAAEDSLLRVFAAQGGDPLLGARVAVFCFPREFHVHRGLLCNLAPRRFRRLLRLLPRIVRPHRLPMAIDALRLELASENLEVPRGLLLHLLKKDLRVAITQDPTAGEMAVPDPRSAQKRLVDILLEAGKPMQLDDLVFAWRERFRRASRTRIAERLRGSPLFVMLGPETWSLRDRHAKELLAATPVADRIAKRICSLGGRQNVAMLLAPETPDDRTIWLVLDRLAVDPRVRLLGRGDACPATHRQSQVLERLLADFRRAAGDVVMSLFVANQPPQMHRLIERLFRNNRFFVMPSEDRIDLLTNYPFDESRLRRLTTIVDQQLQARSGYAPVAQLKAVVDRTDLGGDWLTPTLLADLLRRHGPFEVLAGGIVARRDLAIGAFVMRAVRQALREVGGPLTVEDILQQRPDLAEFSACLHELLAADPHVQSKDGARFSLV